MTTYTPEIHQKQSGLIYKVTNKVNGKVYIGQTAFWLAKRKKEHLFDAKNEKKYSLLHKAIRKYGEEAFKWEVLYLDIDIDKLDIAEMCGIYLYESFGERGYNMTEGGHGSRGVQYSLERNKKISQAHMGNKYALGMRHSEESKAKMSLTRRGKDNGNYKTGKYVDNKTCIDCGKKISHCSKFRCLMCHNKCIAENNKKKSNL